MFDKEKIHYYGSNLHDVSIMGTGDGKSFIPLSNGPSCPVTSSDVAVGSYECINCKYCYRVEKRLWDAEDSNGILWKNAQFDGFVYCSHGNNRFISKIKKHIFNLQKKKIHIKNLSNERH